MGLDNGIIIKEKNMEKSPIPKRLQDKYDTFEIAYWRKCWGIRKYMIGFFTKKYGDPRQTRIDVSDLPMIIYIMKQFTKRKFWEEEADSIWTYDEFKSNQKLIVKRLKWLERYMKKHPEVEVYFYDSF